MNAVEHLSENVRNASEKFAKEVINIIVDSVVGNSPKTTLKQPHLVCHITHGPDDRYHAGVIIQGVPRDFAYKRRRDLVRTLKKHGFEAR